MDELKKNFRKRIIENVKRRVEERLNYLTEYYRTMQSVKNDKILGNYRIEVYSNERTEMTPHCHIYNIDKTVDIEVALNDFRIVHVKSPQGAPTDWAYFSDLRDRFFAWLDMVNLKSDNVNGLTNMQYMRQQWNAIPNAKYKFNEKGDMIEMPSNANQPNQTISPEAAKILNKPLNKNIKKGNKK